jgi:hypothetical protein
VDARRPELEMQQKKYFLRKVELVSENVDQHFYEKS